MKATITALSYREENPIGIALKITGAIIIVVGLIVGFISGDNYRGFMWGVALPWWGISTFAGTTLLGISEVITLLHQLVNTTVYEWEPDSDDESN